MHRSELAKALRLVPPERRKPSFCKKLSDKAIRKWADGLPVMEFDKLIVNVMAAMQELADIDTHCDTLLAALELVMPKVALCKPELVKLYSKTTSEDSHEGIEALERAQALDEYVLTAYGRVLLDKKLSVSDIGLAAVRVMESCFEILQRCAHLYIDPPPLVWAYLYRIHELADTKKITSTDYPLIFRSSESRSVDDLFFRCILFASASTAQLHKEKMVELEALLPHMTEWVKWGPLKSMDEALFMVDVSDFRPPTYRKPVDALVTSMKGLDLTALMTELGQKQNNRFRGLINRELKDHLQKIWSEQPLREGDRQLVQSRVKILVGIYDIYGSLTQGQTANDFITEHHPKNPAHIQARFAQNEAIEPEWLECQLEDIKTDGSGVRLIVFKMPSGLASGDVIALQFVDKMHVGIVKWLKADEDGGCQIGVQFTSRSVQPCVLLGLSREGYWTDPSAGLVSVMDMDGESRQKIICHRASFEKAKGLKFYTVHNVSYVHFVGKEAITGSVLVATFEPIDPLDLPDQKLRPMSSNMSEGRETLNQKPSKGSDAPPPPGSGFGSDKPPLDFF